MARRRDTGTVTFDVSYDAGEAPADDGDDVAAPPPSRRRPRIAWRSVPPGRRRLVGAVAGGLVVVVASGWVAGTAVSAAADAQRLREAPGGVVSLEGELSETVRFDVDDLAAVLPDGVLAVVEGTDVVARDLRTGQERWRTAVGEEPRCGPRPQVGGAVDWASPVEVVTCLHDDDARVTVLGADGELRGQRDLDPVGYAREHQVLAPATDGGLVVVEHDPGLPARVELTAVDEADPWAALDSTVRPTARGTVHVEDALTGERRFEVPLSDGGELSATSECYDLDFAGGYGTGEVVATLRRPTVLATPHLVAYGFCGAWARATGDGTSLPPGDLPSTGDVLWFHGGDGTQVVGDGTYFLHRSRGTKIEGPDASAYVDDLALLAPSATDGTDGLAAFGTSFGGGTVALDPAYGERWRTEAGGIEASSVVATAGTVVLVGWDEVGAFDPSDGTRRWMLPLRSEALGVQGAGPTEWFARATVTDGTRVMLLLSAVQSSGTDDVALVTVDLATGEPSFRRLDPVDLSVSEDGGSGWPQQMLVAIDGEAVLLDLVVLDGGYRVSAVRTLGRG